MSSVPASSIVVRWTPLPCSMVKLNFDASWMDHAARLGYLVRDHLGEVIFAGSSFSIAQTILEAELQAAWKGFI